MANIPSGRRNRPREPAVPVGHVVQFRYSRLLSRSSMCAFRTSDSLGASVYASLGMVVRSRMDRYLCRGLLIGHGVYASGATDPDRGVYGPACGDCPAGVALGNAAAVVLPTEEATMNKLIVEERTGSGVLRILQGDISIAETEAIVRRGGLVR